MRTGPCPIVCHGPMPRLARRSRERLAVRLLTASSVVETYVRHPSIACLRDRLIPSRVRLLGPPWVIPRAPAHTTLSPRSAIRLAHTDHRFANGLAAH